LYVLPPDEENWLLGTPYLKVGDNTVASPQERLEMDPNNCGWFKKVYNSASAIPATDAWIWLGSKKSNDRIGVMGLLGEDPELDWKNGNPTPINLKQKFEELLEGATSGKIYFFANEGTWRVTPPTPSEFEETETDRCRYSFAAIIYERTVGNGDGFSWYGAKYKDATGKEVGSANGSDGPYGICKGIVKNTLGANGKMQFNGYNCDNTGYAANPHGSNWDDGSKDMAVAEANFNNAFKKTDKNETRCWDMPFQKRPSGLWEFDAYYLCPEGLPDNAHTDYNSDNKTGCGGNGNVGGFYPGFGYNGKDSLRNAPFDGDRVDIRKDFKWCFDRGWSGSIANGRDSVDLSTLTSQTALDAAMKTACGSSATRYPIDGTNAGLIDGEAAAHCVGLNADCRADWGSAKNVVGGHLCFESQDAEFTYEPGQEFFFRGDDDIWVFINNQLVVDLGGTHMPAPGYVKLDTIKTPKPLVEGDKYPIKIFFCDRRGSGSNVRISTNIYFSQKSGLYLEQGTAAIPTEICLETTRAGGGCGAIDGSGGSASSSTKCGTELEDDLIYYITRRDGFSDKTELLKANSEHCTWDDNAKILTCYGSIIINFKIGTVHVTSTATGLVGTWVVWAESKSTKEARRLGTTSGRTVIQVVWGNIVKEGENSKLDTIVKIPYKNIDGKVGMEAVASKLIPIGFADGAWVKDSSSAEATFEVDMTTSPGKKVRLQQSSWTDPKVPGSYLKADSSGTGLDSVDINGEFTIPPEGILVLYFTGEFEADTTATYQINSRATDDPFALKVYQPKIEFIDTSSVVTKSSIIALNQRVGSDPSKPGSAKDGKWVFVGTPVSRRIAAFDPIDSTLCETCTFLPREVFTDPFVRTSGTDSKTSAIQFSNKKLENGIGSLSLNSIQRIQADKDSVGFFTVSGPSKDKNTISRWDSLYFNEPPVPYPMSAEIFDRNGDGKGDSIRIVYNRTFPSDTLPNMVQVIWSLKDTISFGLAQLSNGKYPDSIGAKKIDTTENRKYWIDDNKYLRKGVCPATVKDCGDTIVIAVPYDSAARQFSSDIKTAVHSVDEVVLSWSTYTDQGIGTTDKFPSIITDRIQPIIISARYEAKDGDGSCGTDANNKCTDYVHIELSEPVEGAEGATGDMVNFAFAYKLQAKKEENTTFEVQTADKSLPQFINWGRSSSKIPANDSSVRLVYYSYKNDNDNSNTPYPGDSVRLLDKLGAKPLEHAFRDIAGNPPNPNEWGRRLEGKGRSSVNKNLIAAVDPETAEEALKERIRNRFGRQVNSPGYTISERFNEGPIQFMPVPGGWKGDSLSKELGQTYPSTIGAIFWPEAGANIRYLESESGYGTIPRGNIYFVANSFYHTNLGNYVVKSGELRIPCDDPVFKIDGAKDCTDEIENGLYLAWDLRDNKARWVGTGAYVQVYNYYWEVKDAPTKVINQKDVNVNGVLDRYPSEGNKIEMFGVRRAAVKNK
jgi:fibro-slime domain-containing protein